MRRGLSLDIPAPDPRLLHRTRTDTYTHETYCQVLGAYIREGGDRESKMWVETRRAVLFIEQTDFWNVVKVPEQ